MAEFTLGEVTLAVEGTVLKSVGTKFNGVTTDTRKITHNNIFVALQGENFNGHEFVKQAVEKGADCVIVSECHANSLPNLPTTVICVDDTLHAYQKLAGFHRDRFMIPVIAITGSNGKTTTKDLTAAILNSHYCTLKTQANFNNEIGLPLTLLQLNAQHKAAVVEMGMRGLGQIKKMTEYAKPTMGIVTNVGETHMELLGSLENIAQAKGELVEAVKGTVILNADNQYVLKMREKAAGKVILFGCSAEADVMAENIVTKGNETAFDCTFGGSTYKFTVPMVGAHNVYNALAAIAAGWECGVTPDEMQEGLLHIEMSAMRLAVSQKNGWTIINDAYNASPMSMKAAVSALSEIASERRLAVLADMLELGSVSDEAHREVGRQLAQSGAAGLVTIGKSAELIAEAAAAGGVRAVVCHSHEEAAAALKEMLKPGDTILFKGSRGMQVEKVIDLI